MADKNYERQEKYQYRKHGWAKHILLKSLKLSGKHLAFFFSDVEVSSWNARENQGGLGLLLVMILVACFIISSKKYGLDKT